MHSGLAGCGWGGLGLSSAASNLFTSVILKHLRPEGSGIKTSADRIRTRLLKQLLRATEFTLTESTFIMVMSNCLRPLRLRP